MLGSVEGQRIVELGAGIGRFTGELARSARSVLAVDFMEHLIDENRARNGACGNVSWLAADATTMVRYRHTETNHVNIIVIPGLGVAGMMSNSTGRVPTVMLPCAF